MHHQMGAFRIDGRAIRYSQFVPQLYHYCRALGMQRARMMPSRAFCSDESQGYPVILIAQHFGTFPFDHGRVGGRVAVDRHGPHAHHGEDMVIVQASHVGYDPEQRSFGQYPRPRTAHGEHGANCGKMAAVLAWYQAEYAQACRDVQLVLAHGHPALLIDNGLLDPDRSEGLILRLAALIDPARPAPLDVRSTAKLFAVHPSLAAVIGAESWQDMAQPIGARLTADLFSFRHAITDGPDGHDQLEAALAPYMPVLVTSPHPALDSARIHTQLEFDRTYRSIQREAAYADKNVVFVAGLNVDVASDAGLPFPLTKFVPWAAYVQLLDGRRFVLEQEALWAALSAQPHVNQERLAFDDAIALMEGVQPVELPAV